MSSYVTECSECGTEMAKNDDGRFDEDGEVRYLCDTCIEGRVAAGRVEEWEGALGPQSEDEPMYYELATEGKQVVLTGPAPGMRFEYTLDEFGLEVARGEWVFATPDDEGEQFLTPNGERAF